MFKPISISLSPNTEKDDIFLAFKMLFRPCRWLREVRPLQSEGCLQKPAVAGNSIQLLEGEFKKYLGVKYAFSFNSGRSALMAILNSLGIEKGGEILLQAFTCNAAVNPIIWSGSLRPGLISRPAFGCASLGRLKPVFVDINEQTFNIDAEDLKRKITSHSRILIVQHTFGLPAYMDEILKICRENNLILIEDCAHALGAAYQGKKIGTLGQVSFFSFSRDKVISSVYGGMVATNDDELAKKLEKYQLEIGYPTYCWVFQQLLHPILMNWLILPTYSVLGKYLLILFQQLHVLSKAVHWKEKRGRKPSYFPKRMPDALAVLALNQFKKLEKFNIHRKRIADLYHQELKNSNFELIGEHQGRKNIFLRFTVKHPKAHQIIKQAWRNNLLIGDWYTNPIAPHDTKLDKMQYIAGSCPKAEKLSEETFNLPTHINISEKEAGKIIEFLKQWTPLEVFDRKNLE